MKSAYDKLKLLFLGVLALSCAGIWSYQVFYVWPRDRCEAMGDWWDSKDRACGVPMPIWRITGRSPGAKPAATPLTTKAN